MLAVKNVNTKKLFHLQNFYINHSTNIKFYSHTKILPFSTQNIYSDRWLATIIIKSYTYRNVFPVTNLY
jgi:hypothetical protein